MTSEHAVVPGCFAQLERALEDSTHGTRKRKFRPALTGLPCVAAQRIAAHLPPARVAAEYRPGAAIATSTKRRPPASLRARPPSSRRSGAAACWAADEQLRTPDDTRTDGSVPCLRTDRRLRDVRPKRKMAMGTGPLKLAARCVGELHCGGLLREVTHAATRTPRSNDRERIMIRGCQDSICLLPL